MHEDEYLMADPVFFDAIELAPDATGFEVTTRPAPQGWSRLERGIWVGLQPPAVPLPAQGWKVHLSTTAEHSDHALAALWDFCTEQGIAFKFLRSRRIHHAVNAKGAHRASSGKLAAIYPVSDDQLERTLQVLGGRLQGIPGPYVLSDLRFQDGPLYLRYGGFLEGWTPSEETGEPVMCLVRPDGTREPDRRRPVFAIPEWAPVPAVVQHQMQAMSDVLPVDPGYQIKHALHHSNAGGVYVARDRAGRDVVLKEARPHAGLDGAGDDAVARLHREAAVLKAMSGTGVVPELLDELVLWEHHFIVEELIDGQTLHEHLARTHPYLYPCPGPEQLADYTTWALALVEQVRDRLERLHDHGFVFADLHPANIMLAADGRVLLLDTELAFDIEDDQHRVTLGDPGYRHVALAAGGRRLDDYALACLELAVFLPLTTLVYWDRGLVPGGKAEQLATAATELFPLPAGWKRRVLAALRRTAEPSTTSIASSTPSTSITSIATARHNRALADPQEGQWVTLVTEAILASATPDRPDRLYPGDPQGFGYGHTGLAYGAAGVLHALRVAAPDAIPAGHVAWLGESALADQGPRSGLYDGPLGAAVVLAEVGEQERALEVLGRAEQRFALNRSVDLFGGAAGRGLGALRLFDLTADPCAWQTVERSAAELEATLRAGPDTSDDALVAPRSAGLMRGWSGPALFLTRLYEITGDLEHLRLAVDALQRDLGHCEPDGRGGLHLADRSNRLLLYLASGSIGVGLTLRELLPHLSTGSQVVSDDEVLGLTNALEAVRHTCDTEFTMFPGLFDGRAGVLAGKVLLGDPQTPPARTPHRPTGAYRHLRDLAWHLVPYAGGLALPGFGLVRLSMDLATGSAGALLAIHLATEGTGEILPALGLTPTAASPMPVTSMGRR